jgi:hypothetical protein
MRHRVPFHRSAKVLALGVNALETPTAVHDEAEVHETPETALVGGWARAGSSSGCRPSAPLGTRRCRLGWRCRRQPCRTWPTCRRR